MKLDLAWEFRANELEIFSLISAVIGVAMFLVGLFWDFIAKSQYITFRSGLGAMQILWMAGWGIYITCAIVLFNRWKDK